MTSKKNFYIVARTCDITGIGAIALGYIAHSIFALDRNMIPVCDLKHYRNQYFKDGKIYQDNVWEYFFEQPCGISLNNLTNNDNIVGIGTNGMFPTEDSCIICADSPPINSMQIKNKKLSKLRLRYKSLLKFNNELLKYATNDYENLIKKNDTVLGVLCRGTDYAIRQSIGEQIQPSVKQIIKKIYEFRKKHPDINKIYLATEDEFIYKQLKNEFGNDLIDNNQYRYSYQDKNKPFLCDIKTKRKNHNYKLAFEYLSSLFILSKCNYFVGGRCTGSILAWIMQDNWKDSYIWKLGRYGKSFNERLFSNTIQRISNKDFRVINILGIKIKKRINKD